MHGRLALVELELQPVTSHDNSNPARTIHYFLEKS